MSEPKYELNGIQEADFLAWKHHPVTKVFMRFVLDWAEHLRRDQIDILRLAKDPPQPYLLGEFKGRINTLAEIADVSFEAMLIRYEEAEAKDEEEPDAA